MSKRLLMGNEAIALGALRAGALVFTGYPGTPSTEILETVAREKPGGVYYEWSVNEKSAMEVAAGAAQSGARALVTMKQVGLNVASDPLMSLNYVGVKAGMIIVVADDPGPISSQTEQDTRHFGRFAKLCVFDPSTPEEAYLMAGEAFAWSERIGRPVILRPTTRICHSYATVEILPDLPRAIPEGFTKDGGRWAIFPRLSYANKIKIEETLKGIAEFEGNSADDFQGASDSKSAGNLLIKGLDAGEGIEPGAKRYDIASGAKRYGIASGGVSWLYVREALAEITAASGASEVASSDRDVYKKDAARGSSPRHDSQGSDAAAAKLPNYDLLKIGAYPLPEKRCLDFLNGVDEVLVLEELDPFIEDELARLAGRYQIGVPIRGKRTGDIFNAGEGSTAFARADIERFLGLPAGQGKQENQGDSDQEEGAVRNQNNQSERSLQNMPPLPIRPPVLCAGCPHRGSFFAVKEAMKGRPATYSGDIGCYTLGNAMPLDMVDTCLCMGAGITQAQGIAIASSIRSAAKAPVTNPDLESTTITPNSTSAPVTTPVIPGRTPESATTPAAVLDCTSESTNPKLESASDPATNFAFIGDSTFLHTGIPGLINAAWNGTDVVLCILDNSTTAMTGGQPHPGMGMRLNGESSKKIDLYEIAKAAGADSVCRVNAFDLDACKNAAANAADGKGVRVIIFEGPCINIVPKGDPLAVTEKDCTGCSLCVTKLGCPALSMREDAAAGNKTGKLASIDPVLCTGCGLCAKVCPFGAIGKE